MPELVKSIRFESFKTFDDSQLIRMRVASEAFATELASSPLVTEWLRHPRWLTLLGSNGAGKTMLAKLITKVFKRYVAGKIDWETPGCEQRFHGGFVTWHQLCGYLRDREFRVFEDICNDQFVALDDIASEYASDFTRAKLSEFCDRGLGKWRVFTANITLEQIGQILDPRIASRMLRGGSVVVEVDVQDFNTR